MVLDDLALLESGVLQGLLGLVLALAGHVGYGCRLLALGDHDRDLRGVLHDLACLGVGRDHLPRVDTGGVLLGDRSQGQAGSLERAAGLVLGLSDDVGNRLGLHASGDDGRDGAAQPHLLTDLRLAGDDVTGRNRVGVGPRRRAPVEPLLLQGELRLILGHADDVGDGHPPPRTRRQVPGGTRPGSGHGQQSDDDGRAAVEPAGVLLPSGYGGGLLGVGRQGPARQCVSSALGVRSDGADGQGDGAHADVGGGRIVAGGVDLVLVLELVVDG